MAVVTELGGSDWFVLGDRDIGLHLVRSERLRAGEPLSAISADFARRYGLGARLLPASDDRLRTRIVTPGGELEFQEWLVGRRAADPVSAVRFEGVPGARPAPGVLEAIAGADAIVLAPSNPFVSLAPILAVDGVRDAVCARREQVVAITPMIGSQAVKGPLAGMLATLGHDVSAVGVADVLAPLAAAFVLDSADDARSGEIRALGMRTVSVPTLMRDPESAAALARAALAL
jgi:LPPG:FO 2-phospho-L-lactate transferase